MAAGIPYDSEEARQICGAISALMTGEAYAASAELAAELGAFPRFAENREPMLRVIRNHRRAAHGEDSGYEHLSVPPVPLERQPCSRTRRWPRRRGAAWDRALALGEAHGFRNAQVTVIAPTGTIGLVMDCDTTGIEPDFALVKFKKLAGGGYFKIINQLVPLALARLGYGDRADREDHRLRRRPRHAARVRRRSAMPRCAPRGFTAEAIAAVERGAGRRLRHPLRLQQVDARRALLRRDASASTRSGWTSPASACSRRWASPRTRSRRRTSTSAAR